MHVCGLVGIQGTLDSCQNGSLMQGAAGAAHHDTHLLAYARPATPPISLFIALVLIHTLSGTERGTGPRLTVTPRDRETPHTQTTVRFTIPAP